MARVLIALCTFFSLACADELLWPLDGYEYLTGGHADSRYDHYHGGVDIRTTGKHLPVRAPADGYVERIAISPSGYGKVLYCRLVSGQTAVFGHLHEYAPRFESIVRDSQLVAGTYRVDLIYEDTLDFFKFKQGETLAFTGQTGRGAPHLHYELRDEAVQTDPLAAYPREDNQPPVITELRWIDRDELTLQATGRHIDLENPSKGRYQAQLYPHAPFGFLISCYDPGPWNRNAVVSEIRVRYGQEVIYRTFPSKIDLLGPKSIYAELVYSEWQRNDRDLRRLFDPPLHNIYYQLPNGWITPDRDDSVTIEVLDRSGNIARSNLIIPHVVPSDIQFDITPDYTEPIHTITGFSLAGDQTALSWASLSPTGTREVEVGDILDGFFDQLTLTYTLPPDEVRAGLYWYKRSGSGKSARWTVPNEPDSIMSCYLLRGGTYGLARDPSPPRLLVSKHGRNLTFDLRDPESGIDDSSVRCTVDGMTAIAEYEYEENGGAIWTQESLQSGTHQIVFVAANRAGIEKRWEISITL